MLMRPPPVPPYWPMYPEPERSRLEASYRAEHAAYMFEVGRHFQIMIGGFCAGAAVLICVSLWLLLR
jgi:hypothetical protein